MLDFMMYTPTRILFGKESLSKLSGMLELYGAKKILALYDEDALVKCGLKDALMNQLDDSGIPYLSATGVRPNPRISLVREYIAYCWENDVDFILAIGGGSTIDSAKAIAAGVVYDSDIWECFAAKRAGVDALPVGVVLTLPASGSETNGDTVILNEETQQKRYINSEALRPKFAILNPAFTYSLPRWQTACGVADIISHLMERYFTIAEHTDITDRMIEGAIRTMMEAGPAVLEHPDDYELRAQVMWTGTLAEHGILNAGNHCDSPSHIIGHELGGFYDLAHGATLTIIYPAWMKYVWRIRPRRFVQFSQVVMGVDRAGKSDEEMILAGIGRLEEFFRSMGLPVRMSEAKIGDERLEEMAASAMEDREFIGAFGRLKKEDVLKVLRLAQ